MVAVYSPSFDNDPQQYQTFRLDENNEPINNSNIQNFLINSNKSPINSSTEINDLRDKETGK